MSSIKSRRDVARHTVRGREFRVERIDWRNSDGLSFDVYDVVTGECLTNESLDCEPTAEDIADLLDRGDAEVEDSAPMLLVYGNPADGFTHIGPVTPNNDELDRFVDVELRGETWWYMPLVSLQAAIRRAGSDREGGTA